MTRIGVLASMLLAVTAATSALQAQDRPGNSAFLMLRGPDTLVVERFARTADTIRGTISVKGQPRQEYVAVLGPDFRIGLFTLDLYPEGAAATAPTMLHAELRMQNDSAILQTAGTVQRFATSKGAALFVSNSFALSELFTRHARAAGGALEMPAWAASGATSFTIAATAVGRDSMTLTIGGQVQRLLVDSIGRIFGGSVPSQRVVLVRLDPAFATRVGSTATNVASARPDPLPVGLTEREVTVPGPVPLPGLLTLPAGKGPFPGVILVHGSGAGDRDEAIGGNRPFRDIAWGLAQQGIAVLRYDKRAHVAPTWSLNKPITVNEEAIEDALSALTMLRKQPEIDPKRSYLLGHSLGAMLAPRIAKSDSKLAGVIIMAGATTVHLADQMDRQFAYLVSISGADSAAERKQLEPTWAAVRKVQKLAPADSLDTKPIIALGWTTNRYWLDLAAYDPARVMRDVHIPALVLQGMHDWKVPPDQLDGWLAEVGPRKDIVVKRYPGLNHLFIAGSGRTLPAEEATVGHIDPRVIADIVAFIRGR